MKNNRNYFRTQTGVAQAQIATEKTVVNYDTLERSAANSSKEVGILHAGVIRAHRK